MAISGTVRAQRHRDGPAAARSARQRAYRARKHEGRITLPVEVDEAALAAKSFFERSYQYRRVCNRHVRFTPKSGHVRRNVGCPLWAKSGHRFIRSPHWRGRANCTEL